MQRSLAVDLMGPFPMQLAHRIVGKSGQITTASKPSRSAGVKSRTSRLEDSALEDPAKYPASRPVSSWPALRKSHTTGPIKPSDPVRKICILKVPKSPSDEDEAKFRSLALDVNEHLLCRRRPFERARKSITSNQLLDGVDDVTLPHPAGRPAASIPARGGSSPVHDNK